MGQRRHSAGHGSGVSIVCQHHELRDATMCQAGLDVDAAKLLNRLKMWPMVTIGARLDENSKTFARKLMGVRSPLPARPSVECIP